MAEEKPARWPRKRVLPDLSVKSAASRHPPARESVLLHSWSWPLGPWARWWEHARRSTFMNGKRERGDPASHLGLAPRTPPPRTGEAESK